MRFLTFVTMISVIPSSFCVAPEQVSDFFVDTSRDEFGRLIVLASFQGGHQTHSFRVETESEHVHFRGYDSGLENDLMLVATHASDERGRVTISRISEIERFNDGITAIGIGYNSEFAQAFGSVMLVPRYVELSRTPFRIILSPSDPESFCMDRQLIKTSVDIIDGRNVFEMDVSLLRAGSGSLMPLISSDGSAEGVPSNSGMFHISTNRDRIHVPENIRSVIAETIRIEGLSFDRNLGGNYLERGCAGRLSRLPSIQFGILRQGQVVGNIILAPEDYIKVDTLLGTCKVQIDVRGVHSERIHDHYLGRPFVEKIGTFFDYGAREIGFCEPI